MTKQEVLSLSDLLWKIIIPILFAICSYFAANISSTQQKIIEKLDTLAQTVHVLQIEQAVEKTRLDNHVQAQ
jgi:hypothetical protein